jgi:hypothetical protein
MFYVRVNAVAVMDDGSKVVPDSEGDAASISRFYTDNNALS